MMVTPATSTRMMGGACHHLLTRLTLMCHVCLGREAFRTVVERCMVPDMSGLKAERTASRPLMVESEHVISIATHVYG